MRWNLDSAAKSAMAHAARELGFSSVTFRAKLNKHELRGDFVQSGWIRYLKFIQVEDRQLPTEDAELSKSEWLEARHYMKRGIKSAHWKEFGGQEFGPASMRVRMKMAEGPNVGRLVQRDSSSPLFFFFEEERSRERKLDDYYTMFVFELMLERRGHRGDRAVKAAWRDAMIFTMLAEGDSMELVAQELNFSYRTIRAARKEILHSLEDYAASLNQDFQSDAEGMFRK